jgi:transmembrane sensor
MSYKRAQSLLKKYQEDTLSEPEKALVEKWLFGFQQEETDLTEEMIAGLSQAVWAELPIAHADHVVPKRRTLWPLMGIAASLFLTMGSVFYFYLNQADQKSSIKSELNADILPGTNKAILTLSNGKKISLTDANQGELIKQSGISISKTKDGQLVYQVKEHSGLSSSGIPEYNTVETPRGGQYQVNLPDGTKVWLNAGTSLQFPLSFLNVKTRKVVLSGEAYFEVEKDASKPFIVQSDRQLVQVLGTHFNVNAYADEMLVKTTLLEGSVKVSLPENKGGDFRVLEAGEQAQIKDHSTSIVVSHVDTQMELAWKNGQFSFENEPIENIMRQISRWYDVEVIYEDNVTGKTVWGTITRYGKVSKVLSILEKTGKIHFKVEGRRIIVKK